MRKIVSQQEQKTWWSDLEYKHIPSRPGIYAIVNILNGDFYIGSAASLYNRKCEHVGDLRKNKHRNSHLQNAYNLYGANTFRFVIIENAKLTDTIIEREQHYIDTLNPKYNIARIAGSQLGMQHSEATKRKIGAALKGKPSHNKGKPLSEEARANISAALKGKPAHNKGKPMSEAQKAKLSAIRKGKPAHNKGKPSHNKGKPMSEAQKAKMSAALMGHEVSEETRAKMSVALMGREASEEAKAKMSEAHKGKTRSDEARKSISEGLKGKKKSSEHIKRREATKQAKREADPTYGKKKKQNKELTHPALGDARRYAQ